MRHARRWPPALAAWAPPGAPSIPLDVARLADGPWCGTAPFRFDADLFRVRRVRVRLRLEADTDAVRSRTPARGARAGWANAPAREVQDVEVAIDVAPPALRGPS